MSITNKLKFIGLFVLAIIFLVCCTNNDYCTAIQLRLNNDSAIELNHYESVVIIPGSGCTGCISAAEYYFIENCNDNKILFILTNFISEKSMSIRLGGKDNIDRSNVIVDKNNNYYLSEFEERIYPIHFKVKDMVLYNAKKL